MSGAGARTSAALLSERIARTQEFIARTRRLVNPGLEREFEEVVNAASLLQELEAVDPLGERSEWVVAFALLDSALDDLLKAVDRRARQNVPAALLENVAPQGRTA